jgi:adenine-specific DNA-methyltransferase
MIYIDPPYNKDKDFIYPDKWSDPIKEYKRITGQIDEDGNVTSSDSEDEGGRHTKWLNMMYPRLRLARNLLTDDGYICIQIDDDEYENLKKISNEIFGEENFVTTIAVKMSEATGMKMAHADKRLPKLKEYILVYKKEKTNINPVSIPKEEWDKEYKIYVKNISRDEINYIKEVRDNDKRTTDQIEKCEQILSKATLVSLSEVYKEKNLISESERESFNYDNAWRILRDVATTNNVKLLADRKKEITESPLFFIETPQKKAYIIRRDYNSNANQPRIKMLFADDYLCTNPGDFWQDIKTTGLDNEGFVDFRNGKKPLKLITRLIKMFSNENDIILDFFAGSATTAHSVLQLNYDEGSNRKFIMVQLPENLDELLKTANSNDKKDIQETISFLDSINKPHFLSEIGKERIRLAGESIKAELKEKYEAYQQKQLTMIEDEEQAPMNPDDLDIGFKVFKLDYSNLKKWSVDVGEDFYKESKETQNAILSEMLGLEVDNFVEGRTELDVVYEIMLKYGLDLTYPIETYNFDGTNVYSIGYGGLIVCLDTNIEAELADKIVELIKELEPSMVRVAVRDLGFVSDAAKTNFKETLKNGVYAYFDGTDDKADKQNQFKFITI